MIFWCAIYAANAVLWWGFFMSVSDDTPITDFLMAAIWPVSLLLIVGYGMGGRRK